MAVITRRCEISAPAEQVFVVLADPLRLMQLRSDWGEWALENIARSYPDPGSTYWLRSIKEEASSICGRVLEMQPNKKLVLEFSSGATSRTEWVLLPTRAGCLLLLEMQLDANSEQAMRGEEERAQSWLGAIKRYCELGHSGWEGALRWILDRHVLKLRAEQRRIIFLLLALQLITLLSFVAALLGIGLVSLVVSWFRA